jgi:hypothetical protein
MSWAASKAVGSWSRRCAPYWLLQNCPAVPSAASCSRMYWRTCSSSNPTVETASPRAQKCSPEKFRSLPHSRAIAMALFPVRNPITEDTGCLGGIAIHMGTWSGIRCPSRIWHSFCRASAWKIGPHCRRVWPKMIFRRRLGTNTTWYLQSHFEWDRLC